MTTSRNVRRSINRKIQKEAAQFLDKQSARLGKLDGVTVLSDTPGIVWARLINNKEIEVHNRIGVTEDFDTRVVIGRDKNLPNIWQILEVKEDYPGQSVSGNRIRYHAAQHEFNGADELAVSRKQITSMTVRVEDAANFIVSLYGDVVNAPTGLAIVQSQSIDLSSYVVTAGAQYISIEIDDDGTVSINNTGTVFDAPEMAAIAYVATLDPGKYLIAYILMYEGQTELSDNDIHVPTAIGVLPKSVGLQINEAAADTPADGDKFGFWDIVDTVLKSITWANIKAALKTVNDALYQPLDSDLTAIAALTPTNDDVIQRKAGAWVARTIAQMVTDIRAVLDSIYVPITNGSAVLASQFAITGTAGTFQDTGLAVTLPSAGTYKLTANVRGSLQGNAGTVWYLIAKLYNATDAADVANSERLIVLTDQTGQNFQMTCPIDVPVAVAASKTINLYAARHGVGSPSWTLSNIESNAGGRTTLSYQKIS